MSFWGELRRRNVVKVAAAYAIVGWLLVQVADTVLPIFEAPRWMVQVFTFFVILGFPIALLFSWAYELTPEGVKRAWNSPSSEGDKPEKSPKLDVLLTGLLLGAILGGGAVWVLSQDSAERLNIETLKTEIQESVEAGDFEAAYTVAKQVEELAPDDAQLADMWPVITMPHSISTSPTGARVYRRAYDAVDEEWEDLGFAPLEGVRLPRGVSRLRFELAGYEPVFRTVLSAPLSFQANMAVSLDETGSLPEGMVRVPGWSTNDLSGEAPAFNAPGESIQFEDFFLSRHEVTNREYKAFVDAGGYRQPEYWQHAIMSGGEEIPWAQAMERFVDRTGRTGPSTWEAGDYPDGQDDYPVMGVSWYEAAAYAQFVRQELPSVYHWRRAFISGPINGLPWITPSSNLEGNGAASVGEFQSMSWSGASDMVRVFRILSPCGRLGQGRRPTHSI